jgi:hypothetical protein
MLKKLILIILILGVPLAVQGVGTSLYSNLSGGAGSSTNDQIIYFSMDDVDGSTVNDGSGYGNNGTATGATFVTGIYENAANFDASEERITVSDSASLDIPNVTVAAWVKQEDGSPSGYDAIVMRPRSAPNQTEEHFFLGTTNGDEYTFFVSKGGSYSDTTLGDGATLTQNEWTHLVGTYDGSNVVIYKNGVQIDTAAFAQGDLSAQDEDIYIGLETNDGGSTYTGEFGGEIDEVKIWNYALSSSEVLDLYNSYETPPEDTDAYYVTQSGAGSQSGRSLVNAWSVAQFNNAANWSATEDSDAIDPGDTVYFSGPITSDLTINQGGTVSNQIVFDGYESGSRTERSNDCTGIATVDGVFYGTSTPYITIRDFCFDNPDDHNIDIARGDGYKAKGVKILNSYFVGKDSGYGSVVLGFTPDAEVSGNRYYYAGSNDGRKFVSLLAGTNVKIVNNQTDGGTMGIYIRPNIDHNYNGTVNAPAGASHTIDPEYNLDGLEIAYNYTVRREEEGHSIDSPDSNAMFPLVEVLQVTNVSGTSITVDNTGGEWTGEGDVWSGLYLTSMRDVDGSFGIRSIIADQADNVFTTTEDISSHISIGDYVTVGMGAKNVWVHHNYLEDYGYGNSTYLAEDIVYRSLWENNKTEPTTQSGGMGLKVQSASNSNRRSSFAHTSDTVRCNSTWNLVRYNLFGDLLGQVYRVGTGAAYVAHRVFSAINNDFHPNNAANGYQDRGINLTRATAYKSGNTNEVSDLGYLGSFLGSDTWSAAVATEIYADQPPAILSAVLDTSANPDEVAITLTESVTGQLGLTWVKDGGSETMTCSGSGATRTCTIPDGTSGSNYYITYDADTGNIEDTGGTEMHTFGLPGHWNISGS